MPVPRNVHSGDTNQGRGRAAGDSARGRDLYQRGLAIREDLAAREPANTGYQRHLSVSLEQLGDQARADRNMERAQELLGDAAARRARLAHREPSRLDLAEEAAVSAYLLSRAGDQGRSASLRQQVSDLLEPFAAQVLLTSLGDSLVAWTQAVDDSDSDAQSRPWKGAGHGCPARVTLARHGPLSIHVQHNPRQTRRGPR